MLPASPGDPTERINALQVPKAKRKLAKRTVVAAVLVLLMIPLTLYIGVFYLDNKKYYFISLLVLLECMLPFFLIFEGRKPQARELVIIAVLCAIGIAGRAALFMLPQFKPVMAVTIIAGVAFGGETGFLVGAMTMLASNVLFGQGATDPLADVFHGDHRLPGRHPVPKGAAAAQPGCTMRVWRTGRHTDLRRNYESGIRPHLGGRAQ